MYEQILAELIKQNSGQNKKFLGVLAARIAPKITDATKIEGTITELTNNPILSVKDLEIEWQKEGDRRVTEAKATFESQKQDPNQPLPPANPTPAPGETPQEKQIRELLEWKQNTEKRDKDRERFSLLTAKAKEKKIPEWMLEGLTLKETDDIDTMVGTLETKYQGIKQEIVTSELKENAYVPRGTGDAVDAKTAENDIKEWAAKNNPVAQTV